jgi:hypothetical protein
VVEHFGVFEVITFGKYAWIGICRNDFADKYCVVACFELVFNGAFDVGDAFFDGWGFDFFAWDGCEGSFFEFVYASSAEGSAAVDRLEVFHGGEVDSEFLAFLN